jgi:AraC-like DNA-binding protein
MRDYMNKSDEKNPDELQIPVQVNSEVGDFDFNDVIKYFNILKDNDEPLFNVLDMFPIPIEIFAADGTAVYTNLAGMDLLNIKDRSLLVGKYNCLKDTVCLDELGFREGFERAFSHEKVIMKDFPAPIHDLVKRGVVKEKPFEKAIMDLYTYPIWKNEKLIFVVCVLVVRNLYMGRPDVVRAKEYIDNNWMGELIPEEVAKSVNMSVAQLYRLFKEHTGFTPGEYHRKVKIDHIKEKLADKSLSVKEAFAACGEDSQGWFLKVFKEDTGMTPTEFRNQS